ncbi:unnamed protein product [Urochloa decumbens]|uniref:Uncharacterized protein n=1 Tax=Urochloa decumbens TaxID=240449 RepID=A0ABC9BB33_9POAL
MAMASSSRSVLPDYLESLEDAFKVLVEEPGYSRPRSVGVARIRVRNAPALAALLAVSKQVAPRRRQYLPRVRNEAVVRRLATAVGLLELLDISLLPALFVAPNTSQPLIEAVDECGKALREEAAAIVGTFGALATSLSASIHSYYECTPVNKPAETLKGGVAELIVDVKALLDSVCTITQV